ncbi:MAG: thioredoxin [Planctomycetota bacterium]|jgi:thioredoxin
MASEHVIELTDESFRREVVRSDRPVLVDFWADWCQPCRIMGPTVDELAERYAGRVTVAKVDTEANPTLAVQFGVSAIPTLAIFRDGEIVQKFVGVTPKETLAAALDRVAA